MEYFTTFNATFFTAVALFLVCEIFFASIFKATVSFTMNHLALASVLHVVLTIATVIGWFYWSVPGTTTTMFWGFLVMLVLHKPLTKRRMAKIEKIFEITELKVQ